MMKAVYRAVCILLSILLIAIAAVSCSDPIVPDGSEYTVITPTQAPSPTALPTPEPIWDDTVAGRFFGPLYPAANPKTIHHNELRALYIGAAANLDKNIEIAKNSEINALVVDLKESNGVYFLTDNKLAQEIGAAKSMYNMSTVIEKAKANDIKLIGRIVCFKDHILSQKRPDLCIKDKQGNLIKYPLEGNKPFVNPYLPEVWDYNIDIAVEAIRLGFDEIQFDYVRFPTCSKAIRESEYFGEEGTVPTKIEAINRFLTQARIRIQDELGVPLSADIFGIVLTSKLDGQLIGQDWESLGQLGVDTLSPMIYPSHYAKGTVMSGIRFDDPNADTYRFLDAVFRQEKHSQIEGFSHLRPYIQAYSYTREQIFGQIRALREHGITEYIYWNARGTYELENMEQK